MIHPLKEHESTEKVVDDCRENPDNGSGGVADLAESQQLCSDELGSAVSISEFGTRRSVNLINTGNSPGCRCLPVGRVVLQ